jgi:hypothetical protein
MAIDITWSIFNIKIQDTYIASVDDFCALKEHEYGQHVNHYIWFTAHP